MTDFELFTIMYYILDSENKRNSGSNELLAEYVSDLNPFIWKTEDSADPAYFSEFKDFMKDKKAEEDFGYSLIAEFIRTNDEYYSDLEKYFLMTSKEDFIKKAREYLSKPHKGKTECI